MPLRAPIIRLLPGFTVFTILLGLIAWRVTPTNSVVLAGELRQMVQNQSNQSKLATLIRAESDQASTRQIAVSSMPCFWSGEGFYGALVGVYRTTPGMIDRDEVVEVEFDPNVITYQSLMTQARSAGMAVRIYCRSEAQLEISKKIAGDSAIRSDEPLRPDDSPKWYIQQTPLKSVPMTPAQSCRINSALHAREDVISLLTQSQKAMYEKVKNGDHDPISDTERETLAKQIAEELKK